MVTLAIDHGTTSGIAVFERDKLIFSDFIRLDNVTNLKRAYERYQDHIVRFAPDRIVIEKVNLAGAKFGGQNIIKLAQLQAMILLIAQSLDIEVIEVNPMSMKKIITGNGRADKETVARSIAYKLKVPYDTLVNKIYYKSKEGIKSVEYDKSDAIALCLYAVLNNSGKYGQAT